MLCFQEKNEREREREREREWVWGTLKSENGIFKFGSDYHREANKMWGLDSEGIFRIWVWVWVFPENPFLVRV